MTIDQYLYNDAFAQIKIFRVTNPDEDHKAWKLEPVIADVLSLSRETDSNGIFVLKAFSIKPGEGPAECYMDIYLPERTCENVYLLVDDEVVVTSRWENGADVIPQVAINVPGDYQLFYSSIRPDIGIEILKKGLDTVGKRSAIALDLAYILRDERRTDEAIEAFSTAIEENSTDYYPFIERAQLLDKIGKSDLAGRDWETVAKIAGPVVVEFYRAP